MLHKNSIKQIKLGFKATVDNSQPFLLEKNTTVDNKPIKELLKVRSQENQVMISKMLQIRQVNSPYSLETYEDGRDGQYKPSNIGQKILDMKKLIENNEGIEKRIKEAHPIIDFFKMKSDYKQNKKYLKNLSTNSRRIYNCFLPKPFTTTSNPKLKLPPLDMVTGQNLSEAIKSKSQEKLKQKKVKKGRKKVPKVKTLAPPSASTIQNQDLPQQIQFEELPQVDQSPQIQILIIQASVKVLPEVVDDDDRNISPQQVNENIQESSPEQEVHEQILLADDIVQNQEQPEN